MNSTSPNSSASPAPGGSSLDAQAQWLTGSGSGALSVVRLVGKDAWGILQKQFRSQNGPLPQTYRPGLARLGTLPDEKGHGDQLLLVCRYWKGKQVVELQSHHGALADAHLSRTLEQAGFQVTASSSAAPGPSVDLSLALEKERWLPFVPNRVALERFLHWVERDWPQGISTMIADLDSGNLDTFSRQFQASLKAASVGKHLFTPYRVAFLGVPNAGKSSLLNALLGYERAMVSPTAGTTRDLVRATLAHDGWVLDVIDSAGIRSAGSDLEAEGIRRSLDLAKQADLVIWLVDSTDPVSPPPEVEADLLVWTKADLVPAKKTKADASAKGGRPRGELATSAKTGLGLEPLLNAMIEKLVGPLPPAGTMIPFSPALTGCLNRLEKLIQSKSIPEARSLLTSLVDPSALKPNAANTVEKMGKNPG